MLGGSIELTRGAGEIAGLPLSGDVRYSTEGRRRLSVVLQGQRIDAAQLWPGGFDAARLRSFLAGAEGAASAPGEGSGLYGFSPETADLKVEVRAGELQITGQTNLRDVDTTFSVERGTLTIPRMRFTTAAGLGVDLDGQVTGLAAPHSANAGVAGTASPPAARRGNLRWVVNAANAQAVPELVNAIDWPSTTPRRRLTA